MERLHHLWADRSVPGRGLYQPARNAASGRKPDGYVNHSGGQTRPERLLSVEEAGSLAGFDLKAPTKRKPESSLTTRSIWKVPWLLRNAPWANRANHLRW